jgi:catechol 2,3-dioxygenase-like lactoylglutathione lyase family enzyme
MPGVDERPPVWIGHVVMTTPDLARSASFWTKIGMREVFVGDDITIFELRGGTHLLLFPGEAEPQAPFDLMVDDLDATHARFADAGLDISTIGANNNHRWFTVREPSGAVVTVNDTHVGPDPV